MPTYEYECTSCGQHIEVFQRIAEDPLTTCGVCGGKLRKVFHPAGIVFKGSGFYATDSRSSSKSDGTKDAKETKDTKKETKKETGAGSSPPASTSSEGGSKSSAPKESSGS